jgi:adenylate cyclase
MVEELITALSRLPWLFVISRNSSFAYKGKLPDVRRVGQELGVRYVLEGSVRKAASRIRITGQLIDASTGSHIWADRFEGELTDVFDLQDQVTMGVVAAIEPKLRNVEIERARRKPTSSLRAYDLILRALPSLYTLDADLIAQAIEAVDQAIELDPEYARALALKVRLQVRQANTVGARPRASPAEILRLARAAIDKARDDPEVLWMTAFVVATFGRDLQSAAALIDRSLTINSHCAEALAHGAIIYSYSGDHAATMSLTDRALRLNPLSQSVYNVFYARGVLAFFEHDYAGCLDWMERSLRELPQCAPVLRFCAASLGQLGRLDEARDVVHKLLIATPGVTLDSLGSTYGHMGAMADRVLDGLRQAGLPEN